MPKTNKEEAPKRNQVIIVDDDEDLLKLLIFAFESEGFTTKGLLSGNEALTYLNDPLHSKTACLLVLDRVLPDMDGLDILKRLPAFFKKNIPVLILSLLSSERDVLAGLKEGAVDYVTKPFSLPVLMEKAQSLIKRYA